MQLTVWTYEGPPHVGAMRVATAMGGRALRPPCAAGRHLRRPAVHDDRASRQAPAGDLHDLPGARPRHRHRRAVPVRCARCVRAVLARCDDRRRVLHRRADPGRSRRARAGDEPADPGDRARTAELQPQGMLGRQRDLLPAGPQPSRQGCQARADGRPPPARQFARADGTRLPPPRRRRRGQPACWTTSASMSPSSPRSVRRPPIWPASARPTSTC